MFVKKGPLSKVWIAAHFQRKLNKTHVIGTDISLSAKSILDPTVQLALRLSGQLLLGLVRIYQRKVKYLQEDSTEALTKMKMMFRAGAVDLPEESMQAPAAQITHADNADLIDYAIPDDGLALDDLDLVPNDPLGEDAEGSFEGPTLMSLTQDDNTLMLAPEEDLLDIRLGEDNLDDLLLDPMDGNDRPISDVETARGNVSDVEVARDGEVGTAEFDIDLAGDDFARDEELLDPKRKSLNQSSQSALDADLSGLDTTTGAEDNGGMSDFGGFDGISTTDVNTDGAATDAALTEVEHTEPLLELETEEKEEPKPKAKKRKALKFDKNTELSGKTISEQIKDTSDIVLLEGRQTMPLTKRAKFEHRFANLDKIPDLVELPSSLSAPAPPFRLEKLQYLGAVDPSTMTIAPELLEAFKYTAECDLDDEEPEQEEAKEETVEEEKKEEGNNTTMHGDITTDFEFDGGDMFSGMDDLSSIVSKSTTAPTPGKPSTEVEETFGEEDSRREVDQDVQDFEEFFGDTSSEASEKEQALGWSTRTKKMQEVLKKAFKKSKEVSFEEVVGESKSRKTAAGVFYQLLVLQSHKKIKVAQDEPYADIIVCKA